MKTAIIDNGTGIVGAPVECIEKPLWRHTAGLQYTATGYGSRIPTPYMVHYGNKCAEFICAFIPILARYLLGAILRRV